MAFKRLMVCGLLGLLLSFILPLQAQEQSTLVLGTGIIDSLTVSPDGHWLLIATSAGTYLQDTSQLNTPPTQLIGHSDMVWYASFSPDSSIVATASPDLTVRLWETATGRPLDVMSFSIPPHAPRFNADGRLLFITTGTQSPGQFYLYDRVSKQQIGLDGFAPSLVFTEDGALALASFPADRSQLVVQHYVAQVDGLIRRDEPLSLGILPGLSDNLNTFLSPDGAIVVIQDGGNATVDFLDRASGSAIVHVDNVAFRVEFTVDSVYAIATTDGSVLVVDVSKGTVTAYPVQTQPNYRIFGTWLLYSDPALTIHLLDVTTGQDVTLQVNETILRDFTVRDTNLFLLSAVNLYHFNTQTGELLSTTPLTGNNANMMARGDHLALFSDTELKLLDMKSGQLITKVETSPYSFYRSKFAGDDSLFFITNSYQIVHLNLIDQSLQPVLLPSLGNEIQDVVYSPDGQSVAFAAGGVIRIASTANGEITRTIDLDKQAVDRLHYAPDGRLLANTPDNDIQVWDTATGTLQTSLGFDAEISAFAISPDGTTLALASPSGIHLANLQNALAGDLTLNTLTTDIPPFAHDITFSPDGRWLAVGFAWRPDNPLENATVYVWDVENRSAARILKSDITLDAVSVAFSADSRLVAVAGGYVNVWDINEPDEPLYMIPGRALANVAFSPDGLWLLSTEFMGLYARITRVYRADNGQMRGISSHAATQNTDGGGGGDNVPRLPIAISPDNSQFAVVETGGVINLRAMGGFPLSVDAVGIVAYCDALPKKPLSPRTDQTVDIVWSWYAKTEQQVISHINNARYEITLDGEPQTTWNVLPDAMYRDSVNQNDWTVYYHLYVSPLPVGQHSIGYKVTWYGPISDGYADFGPGTNTLEQTGTCGFTVQ